MSWQTGFLESLSGTSIATLEPRGFFLVPSVAPWLTFAVTLESHVSGSVAVGLRFGLGPDSSLVGVSGINFLPLAAAGDTLLGRLNWTLAAAILKANGSPDGLCPPAVRVYASTPAAPATLSYAVRWAALGMT